VIVYPCQKSGDIGMIEIKLDHIKSDRLISARV